MLLEFNIPIDEKAPVVAKKQTIITTQPQVVWKVLTGINKWPKWQNSVTQAKLGGDLAENVSFNWKAGGLSFVSEIHTCKPITLFGWTGKTTGASAIHNWCLEPHPQGTLVKVEESLNGFFPTLLRKKFSKDLLDGMEKNLTELKSYCESMNPLDTI